MWNVCGVMLHKLSAEKGTTNTMQKHQVIGRWSERAPTTSLPLRFIVKRVRANLALNWRFLTEKA